MVISDNSQEVSMYFRTLDDFKNYISGSDFSSSEQLMIMAGDRSAGHIPENDRVAERAEYKLFWSHFSGDHHWQQDQKRRVCGRKAPDPCILPLCFLA